MRGTIWITHPVARVFGDDAMAGQSIPEQARAFRFTQCTGELVISGKYMMNLEDTGMDEDAIADELFKCATRVMPENSTVTNEDMVLHFNGQTIAHGACDATAYISDDALFHNEQSVYE